MKIDSIKEEGQIPRPTKPGVIRTEVGMDEFKEALHKAIRHLEKATQELIRVGSEIRDIVAPAPKPEHPPTTGRTKKS